MDYYTMLAITRTVTTQYRSLDEGDTTAELLDWIEARMEDENEVRRMLKEDEDLMQRQGPPYRF